MMNGQKNVKLRNKVGWENVQIAHVKNEIYIQNSVFPSYMSLCASFPCLRFTQLKYFNKLPVFHVSMQLMGLMDFLVKLAT
jgi:hypothetical protein